jgi:hypothetical protein
LSEDVVMGVLSACRAELGTLFGYTEENRGVGITGGVDYVDMDGPTVVVSSEMAQAANRACDGSPHAVLVVLV